MLTPQALVADERWIPYDSVGFADGRLVLLDVFEGPDGLAVLPIAESTLASYLGLNPDGISSLTEMWRLAGDDAALAGGGGSFEEDGYVALFERGALVWIFASTRTGPLHGARLSADAVTVQTEDGQTLRLDRREPFRVTSRGGPEAGA